MFINKRYIRIFFLYLVLLLFLPTDSASQELGKLSLTYQSQIIRAIDFDRFKEDYYSSLNSVYLNFFQNFEKSGSLYFNINYYFTGEERRISYYQLGYQNIPLGKSQLDVDWGYLSYPLSSLRQFGSFNTFSHRSLKGGKISYRSEKVDLFVFGGNTYSGLKQGDNKRLYGFRTVYRPKLDWTIGAGLLKLSGLETDPEPFSGFEDQKKSYKNDDFTIFSLDSSFKVVKGMYLLGDLCSVPNGIHSEKKGFSLKSGTYYSNHPLLVEIFYNYISPDFPYLGNILPQERKGITLTGQYQPFIWLSVYGGLDTFNEDLEDILDNLDYINDYKTYRIGASFSPNVLPQISFSFNRSTRETESINVSPPKMISDTTFDLIYISLSKQYRRYFWNLYYNKGRFNNRLDISKNYSINRLQLNFRRHYSAGDFVYLNLFLDKKTGDPLVISANSFYIRAGGNFKVSPDLHLNLEAGLNFSKNDIIGKRGRNLGFGGGVFYRLKPLKINCSLRYRYSRTSDSPISLMSFDYSSGKYQHQVFLSVSKDISWGKRSPTGGFTGLGDIFRPKGKISGSVFIDLNQNGLKDPEEDGVPEINILLDGRKMTKTGPEGNYTLPSIPPGIHRVSMDLRNVPAFFEAGMENIETSVKKGGKHEVHLSVIPVGLISGRLFLDANENGLKDKEESIIPGIRIDLIKNGEIFRSVFTATNGVFNFDNLLPGKYLVIIPAKEVEQTYICFEKSNLKITIEPYEEKKDLVLLVKKYQKPKTKKIIKF